MQFKVPLCMTCKHYNRSNAVGFKCRAFPDGIPAEIIRSEHDHREPFSGDGGFMYEADDKRD